ncbi:MAG: LPS export ABC transporter periplasmic protein LptC [Chlorobia bacterium]|nr:LPS export ABC transporter periplasmic protein LptC [Fimbriimonadaceae bacterium]
MILGGCSGSSVKEHDSKTPRKEANEEPKRLYTGKGDATVRDPKGARPIRYIVRWEKTQLDYTLEQGASAGRLELVSGDLFRDGKLGSKFSADSANADKAKNLLVLDGKVVVIALDPKARMECQRLEWKTDEKLLKAFGNVTIKFEDGTIGPVDELWCLPDLKQVGTPGYFQH